MWHAIAYAALGLVAAGVVSLLAGIAVGKFIKSRTRR